MISQWIMKWETNTFPDIKVFGARLPLNQQPPTSKVRHTNTFTKDKIVIQVGFSPVRSKIESNNAKLVGINGVPDITTSDEHIAVRSPNPVGKEKITLKF